MTTALARAAVISVWASAGSTVTLSTGEIVSEAGGLVVLSGEVVNHLVRGRLFNRGPAIAEAPVPTGGLSAPSVSVLPALAATASDGQTASVVGFADRGDGGGGTFYLESGSATAPIAGMVIDAQGGRWKRLFDRNAINAKWFGARGDGVADDTAALQAALNFAMLTQPAAAFGGCTVIIPQGTYRVTSTLYVQGGFLKGNVNVRGTNVPGAQLTNTQLLWDGPSWINDATKLPLLWIEASDCLIENLTIQPTNRKVLYSAIEVGSTQAGVAKALTHNQFRGITCVGTALSTCHFGITVGTIHPQGSNLENFRYDECLFQSVRCGVYYEQGQPINTVFTKCVFAWNGAGIAGQGLLLNSPSMSVQMNDCDFQSLEMGVHTFGGCTSIVLSGGESENCKKVFHGSRDAVGIPGTLVIRDMRLSPSMVGAATESFPASSRDFVYNYAGTSIHIENCFANHGGTPEEWYIAFPASCRVVSTNNDFCTDEPFRMFGDYRGRSVGGVWSTADRYVKAGEAELWPMPSRFGSINPSYAGALTTISGTALSVAVTLPKSELVADYQVRLEVESVTGTPAAGAFCGYVTSKTATGFTITVPTAPGVGSSVTYRYTTWR